MLKAFVRSTTFANIVAFVLIINLVAVVIETMLDIQNSSAQKFWQEIEFVFGWIYVVEMALEIFSYGFDAYWMDGQNQVDFVITWTIVRALAVADVEIMQWMHSVIFFLQVVQWN